MEKIFFFHNGKAGGTSIKKVLEDLVPQRQRCPRIENDEVDHRNLKGRYKRFRGYTLYSGHYGYDVYQAVANGHLPLTNFRHPVDRLVSGYNYFNYAVHLPEKLGRPDHFYAVRLARKVSFEEFMSSSDPRVEIYTRNGHYRQLTYSPWSPELRKSLNEACAFVDQMQWYYICEHPELSTIWFRKVFNIPVTEIPRENQTPKVSSSQLSPANISESTRSLILEKNQLDLALYQYAVKRLLSIEEKLNLVPAEAAASSHPTAGLRAV
jgi:hypothetical protein